MSSRSKRGRSRLSKGSVVEWGSTPKVLLPSTRRPQTSSSASATTSRIRKWDFDFAVSPPKSAGNVQKKPRPDIEDSSEDFIPPTQSIVDSDEAGGSSPILSLSEPALKSLEIFTQDENNPKEPRMTFSASRTLNFDNFSSAKRKVESGFTLTKQQTIEKRLASTKKKHNVDILSTKRNGESERSKEKSDIFSASDDDEASPIISFQSQSPEDEKKSRTDVAIKNPAVESKAESRNTKSGFTATEWFKKLANKEPASKTPSSTASQEQGQISSASSSSQSQTTTDTKKPDGPDQTFSSCKKKKRPKFGLVLKFDSILKKQTSDRNLRRHIAAGKSATFGKISGQQNRRGKIVAVEKIHETLVYIRCQNLKMLPKNNNNNFKVIVNLKSGATKDYELEEKLVLGNDVIISGPWSSLDGSVDSEEVLTNFEDIEVVENSSTTHLKTARPN